MEYVKYQLGVLQKQLNLLNENDIVITSMLKDQREAQHHLMKAIQKNMQLLLEAEQHLLYRMNMVEERAKARLINSSREINQHLDPLPDNKGQYPDRFPSTPAFLANLDIPTVTAMLTFYNLDPTGSHAARRDRLSKHLGVLGIVFKFLACPSHMPWKISQSTCHGLIRNSLITCAFQIVKAGALSLFDVPFMSHSFTQYQRLGRASKP